MKTERLVYLSPGMKLLPVDFEEEFLTFTNHMNGQRDGYGDYDDLDDE